MKTILLCVLSTSLGLSLITGICLLLAPLLEKRYSPKGLYTAAVILMIGFLLPYSLLLTKPLVTVELPAQLDQVLFFYNRPAHTETTAKPAIAMNDQQVNASTNETTAADTVPPAERPAVITPIKATESGVLYDDAVISETIPSARFISWLSLLGWGWLTGAVLFLLWHLWHHHCFVRTLHRWRAPISTDEYQRIFTATTAEMGISGNVSLYVCPTVSSPMLLGLRHPCIYLPDETLTADELKLVLRHELIHYQRRDLWVKATLLLCRAVHWFNPMMLPLSRWLCYCQESSCDSQVTRNASQEERHFYSETIIRVIRRQVQTRTQLCSSFYGGKNGMKKRIFSIMNQNKRKAGLILCIVLLAITLLCGGVLTLKNNTELPYPRPAWVHSQSGTGTVLLVGPTANDLSCPMGIYLNGTPVTIQQVVEASSSADWNCEEGQPNWAEVIIGGDGFELGIHGWMPLHDLTYQSADSLPTATLNSGSETGHTQLYAVNDRETPVIAIRQDGTQVQVLGQLNHWLHVQLDQQAAFILLDHTKLEAEADQKLFDLLPERFSGTTRRELDSNYLYQKHYDEKAALYGGRPLEFWSVEDKAWFGQMEDVHLQSHDHYYLMPGEEDLPQEKAVEIALAAYAKNAGLESVTTEEVDIYPGFYRLGYTDPVYWDVIITFKNSTEIIALVTISSPDGQVISINGHTSEGVEIPLVSPEGNG